MRRGEIWTVAGAGDFAGKPRPGIVVQSDLFNATHPSVTVVPLTTTLVDAELFRVPVRPTKANGLRQLSHAMVDKVVAVRRDRVRTRIGALAPTDATAIDAALRLWLGL